MRGLHKGITLGGRTSANSYRMGCKIRLQKNCKIFTSELGLKSGIMRGFMLDFKVYLSPLLGEGVRSRIERCTREGSRDVERGRERGE